VQIFGPLGGKPIRSLQTSGGAPTRALAYGRGGVLAFADETGVVHLSGLEGKPERVIRTDDGPIWSLAFSADGDRLATAGLNLTTGQGKVRLFDVATGDEMLSLPGFVTVELSPDGRTLAAPWAENLATAAEVRLWQIPAIGERWALRTDEGGLIRTLAAGPDGSLWAVHDRAAIRKRDAADGQGAGEPFRVDPRVFTAALSPDGEHLASADTEGGILLGPANGTGETRRFAGHKALVWEIRFSPDGKRLVSAGYDFMVRVWDSESGKELACLREHNNKVFRATFSPDGQRIASVDASGRLIVWDVAKQSVEWERRVNDRPVVGLAYRPDGKELAAGGADGLVRIWDATTGKLLRTLRGHRAGIVVLAYTPDGTVLASAGHDTTVRLWDGSNGEPLQALRGHTGSVHALAFAPDGKTLYSGGNDRRIVAWDVAGIGGNRQGKGNH
jgi:WD40 repeat protein